MRAKVEFKFRNAAGEMCGEIIEATGVNLLQCDADATMQFMRRFAAKLKPDQLVSKYAALIGDNVGDAAEMEKTRADVAAGKIPERWGEPGKLYCPECHNNPCTCPIGGNRRPA